MDKDEKLGHALAEYIGCDPGQITNYVIAIEYRADAVHFAWVWPRAVPIWQVKGLVLHLWSIVKGEH